MISSIIAAKIGATSLILLLVFALAFKVADRSSTPDWVMAILSLAVMASASIAVVTTISLIWI